MKIVVDLLLNMAAFAVLWIIIDILVDILLTVLEAVLFSCFCTYLFFGLRFDSIIFNLAYLPVDLVWWFFYRLGKGATITRLTLRETEYTPPFWISTVKRNT